MIQNNYGIRRSYTVEITPSDYGTALTWMFPDIPFLRSRPISGIVLSTMQRGVNTGFNNVGAYIQNGTTFPGSAVSSQGAYLTLADETGRQFIQNLPLIELINTAEENNATALVTTNYLYYQNTNGILYFDPRVVVWTKSYVYMPVATGATSALCCQFTVFYH